MREKKNSLRTKPDRDVRMYLTNPIFFYISDFPLQLLILLLYNFVI